MIKYLIRLDDACPTMHRERWQRMENLLDSYGVRPMAGVIANNADPDQLCSEADANFWEKVETWNAKGWAIAMHGDDHRLSSECGGINPIWKKSEFAGLPLSAQKEKIRNASTAFKAHGIVPKYFFAPCHTFDANTLKALKEESDIRIISDTIAFRPYKKDGFVFIPQIGGMCREMKLPGIYTFCFHPSTMDDNSFRSLEAFLQQHHDSFVGFSEIDTSSVGPLRLADRMLSALYFGYRKIKKGLRK